MLSLWICVLIAATVLFAPQLLLLVVALSAAAEADRRAGRRIPPNINNPRGLFYREAVSFSEQLERYFAALGRERVHVIIFDDFKADTAAAVGDTFRFLGVDDAFRPALDIANPSKVA